MSEDYSPQLEDGYTRVANEWLDAMIACKYPASVIRTVLAVVRLTWGWGETWREVTTEAFCQKLGVCKRTFYDWRKQALGHNLIDVRHSDEANGTAEYRVQKMYLDWLDYQPGERARTRGKLLSSKRNVPPTDTEDAKEERTSQGGEGRSSQGCEGRTSDIPIDKESSKESSKESAPAVPSDKERRLLRRQALIAEQEALLSEVPQAHRELLDGFIENCAAANGTGTITLSREVTEIRALLSLREEVGVEAWVYGMFQANAKRATAINYIKKAAGSYRPGSSNGGLPADSPLLKMRGPARAEAFERTKPLEPPRF